jgi:CheY-like chemotaxis protein
MKKSILVIDDDDMIAIQLEAILGNFFSITHAPNGADGIAQAAELKPDLILLDVEMPELDGYAVCRKLRATDTTENLSIIFISAHATTEDRLAGYDAGGDDYITKPFAPDELRRKVGVVLRNQQKNAELAGKVAEASKVAMAAMASAGDTGRILNFLREIVGFTGFGDIADASLRALEEYNLNASIQLRAKNGTLSRTQAGFCSPLEESVLTTMATCGRIVDLGQRSAFNYPHVTIIVNNMPVGAANEYGRHKDNVAMIAEAVDIHMSSLDLMLESINRGDTLLSLLHRNAGTLREIEKRHNEHRQTSADILNQLVKDIEDSFYFMGLTDNQEKFLQDLARNAVERTQALYDQAIETDAIMKSLGDGLDATLQQELQGAAEASTDEVNRIELF